MKYFTQTLSHLFSQETSLTIDSCVTRSIKQHRCRSRSEMEPICFHVFLPFNVLTTHSRCLVEDWEAGDRDNQIKTILMDWHCFRGYLHKVEPFSTSLLAYLCQTKTYCWFLLICSSVVGPSWFCSVTILKDCESSTSRIWAVGADQLWV